MQPLRKPVAKDWFSLRLLVCLPPMHEFKVQALLTMSQPLVCEAMVSPKEVIAPDIRGSPPALLGTCI